MPSTCPPCAPPLADAPALMFLPWHHRPGEHPVDPVPRRLWPRRQHRRPLPLRRLGEVVWPVMTVPSSATPATATGVIAADLRRRRRRHRGRGRAGCARALRGGPLGLPGRRGRGRGGGVDAGGEGRGRRRPRRSTAATRSWATSAAACSCGRIPEFMRDRVVPASDVIAQPLRARLPGRYIDREHRRRARRRRHGARHRPGHRAGDQRDRRRHTRRRPRHGRGFDASGAWARAFRGTGGQPARRGDLTTAVFLANLLDRRPLGEALARTTASVFAVVQATAEAGERVRLRIVQTQDLPADGPTFETEGSALTGPAGPTSRPCPPGRVSRPTAPPEIAVPA